MILLFLFSERPVWNLFELWQFWSWKRHWNLLASCSYHNYMKDEKIRKIVHRLCVNLRSNKRKCIYKSQMVVGLILSLSAPVTFWNGSCQYNVTGWERYLSSSCSDSVWQHVKLSDISLGMHPQHSLVADKEMKEPNKQALWWETEKLDRVPLWMVAEDWFSQVCSKTDRIFCCRLVVLMLINSANFQDLARWFK